MIVSIFVAKTTGRVLLARFTEGYHKNRDRWQPLIRSGDPGTSQLELIKKTYLNINVHSRSDVVLDCVEMPPCWPFFSAYLVWVDDEFVPFDTKREFMWCSLYEFPHELEKGTMKLIKSTEFLAHILNPTN